MSGSGTGFQISLDPDPDSVFKFHPPNPGAKKGAEKALKVMSKDRQKMKKSGSDLETIMDPDLACPERLDPNPVCPERSDPKHWPPYKTSPKLTIN